METTTSSNKINKARKDIGCILDRYSLTLPEIMGIGRPREYGDEEIWGSIKKDYEEIQQKLFIETYPILWQKIKNSQQ